MYPGRGSRLTPSVEQLVAAGIGPTAARRFQPVLAGALARFGIETPRRVAAFLAQCHVESAGFTALEENLMYSSAARLIQVWPSRFPNTGAATPFVRNPQRLANLVYANRNGNGPQASGDGWRYRGRSPIQLTGRDNYSRMAALAGLPLALAVYLAANRLLPLHWAARADAELACFFSAWALALLLAAVSPGQRGWCALLALAGALWALMPLLNAATTHAHLGVSLPARDWALAGMDLAFLATGALLLALAYRLRPLRAPAGARVAAVPPHLSATRGHRAGA